MNWTDYNGSETFPYVTPRRPRSHYGWALPVLLGGVLLLAVVITYAVMR